MTESGRTPTIVHRALAILGAATGPTARTVAILAWLLFVGGGIAVWQVASDPAKGAHAIVLLGAIGIGLMWMLWHARVLALQIGGRSLHVPRVDGDCGWALGIAFVASVLLPATLASVVGVDPRIAFGGLVAAAMLGLLLMWLPVVWAAAIFVLPGALVLARGFSWIDQGFDALKANPDIWLRLPWLAAALALVAAWRRHGLLRNPDAAAASIHRPLLLSIEYHNDAARARANAYGQAPDWMAPAGQTEPAGPARPVRAMRCWLGTPFAPLSRKQWLVQGIGAAAAVGVVVTLAAQVGAADSDQGPLLRFTIGGGVAIVLLMVFGMMPGLRLAEILGRRSGEWAELALLPGWGSAATARAILLRAVALPLLQLAGLMLAGIAAFTLWRGLDATGVLLALLTLAGMSLATATGCLRALAGASQVGSWRAAAWIAAWCIASLSLPSVTLFAALPHLREQMTVIAWLGLGAGWLLVLALLLVSGVRSWRTFVRQPHPFVQT